MHEHRITRTDPYSCKSCGTQLTQLADISDEDPRPARPGAIHVCGVCGQVSVYDGKLQLHPTTLEELAEMLPSEDLQRLQTAVELIKSEIIKN